METIKHNVRDLEQDKRLSLEALIGHQLRDNQQLIIQVVAVDVAEGPQTAQAPAVPPQPHGNGTGQLPEWCHVYAGLSDEQIEAMEQTILQRASHTRPSHPTR